MSAHSSLFCSHGESRQSAAVSDTAVVVALFAILLYVWFRFEWQFGVAALLSNGHDVPMAVFEP